MSTVLAVFPSEGPAKRFLELPVAQIAQLFWMAYVSREEVERRQLEAHAFTAYQIYNTIQFPENYTRKSWEEWAEARGLTWQQTTKSKAELIAENNAKWDKVFTSSLRFQVSAVEAPPDPNNKEAMRNWLTEQRGIREE